MASENADFDSTLPDNDDVKKKAITRLTIAGLVTATALAGLWWLDQDKKHSTNKPVATPQPTPIRSADSQDTQLAQPEDETLLGDDATTADETAVTEAAPPQEGPIDVAPLPGPPPPPKVSNSGRPAQLTPQPSRAIQAPPPLNPEPAPGPGAGKPTSSGPSFIVQLGVFNDPQHAVELVQRLKKQGIKASTETRVQLGPFLNRQEAEKAQSAIRRLGLNAVVTTATATK